MDFSWILPGASSDWAAWVQAFGTIAAVVIAPWLAARQHTKALEQDRIRTGYEMLGRLNSLTAILDKATAYAQEVVEATHSNAAAVGFSVFGTSPDVMSHVQGDLERLDLLGIPDGRLAAALIELRATFPRVIAVAEAARDVEDEWTTDPEDAHDHVKPALDALEEARVAAKGFAVHVERPR